MAQQVARIWNWSAGEVQPQLVEAGAFTDTRFIGEHNQQQKVSFGARFLAGADSLLSRAWVDNVAKLTGSEQKVEQLRREILFAGPEYDEALRQCAVIADEDYKFADVALKKAFSALFNGGKNIQQVALEDIKIVVFGFDYRVNVGRTEAEGVGMELCQDIVAQLMRIRRNKLPFFQRGMRAMSLILSMF